MERFQKGIVFLVLVWHRAGQLVFEPEVSQCAEERMPLKLGDHPRDELRVKVGLDLLKGSPLDLEGKASRVSGRGEHVVREQLHLTRAAQSA